MNPKGNRGLFVAGGACAVLWPILSLAFFAAYPVAAGGAMLALPGGPGAYATRLAELGQRPMVVALEWGQDVLPLMLWPFLLALYRLLSWRSQWDLTLIAVGLGLLGMSLMVLSNTFNPTLSHTLGQAYVEAGSPAEGAAILAVLQGLLLWRLGLNQLAGLLYQGCVGLIGLGLIRSCTWRVLGWVGLVGALLALPAKLPIGLRAPSNIIWTGLAYGIWPIAMGIGLLRYREGQGVNHSSW
ncbi:MAG: hypothetical protein H5T64_09645 [Chloroflexi bacterium]|nr:hypothetical protein [Chloroflexota bacterium]